jgi:micrococcal nuclease
MLQKLFCCFKSRQLSSIEKITTNNTVELKYDYLKYDWLTKLEQNPIFDWQKDSVIFIPPIQKGIVVKVYDGDTITIVSKLPYSNSPLYRFSVRLNGIDCPEIKGDTADEKKCAEIARLEVSNLVLNKIITLENLKNEKYGRILADVYIDNLHINKHMLDKRLAVAYDGKTKKSPKNWLTYFESGGTLD